MSIESIKERADGHLEHYHCGGTYALACCHEGPRCAEDLRLLLAVAEAAEHLLDARLFVTTRIGKGQAFEALELLAQASAALEAAP